MQMGTEGDRGIADDNGDLASDDAEDGSSEALRSLASATTSSNAQVTESFRRT